MNLPPLKKKSVSIGYNGIDLVNEKDVEKIQIGYSIHPNGRSLIGTKNGDWMEEWVVIGNDSSCGDPIFIDTSNPDLPDYTAPHGEGRWDPDLICSTYNGFLKIIEKL